MRKLIDTDEVLLKVWNLHINVFLKRSETRRCGSKVGANSAWALKLEASKQGATGAESVAVFPDH